MVHHKLHIEPRWKRTGKGCKNGALTIPFKAELLAHGKLCSRSKENPSAKNVLPKRETQRKRRE